MHARLMLALVLIAGCDSRTVQPGLDGRTPDSRRGDAQLELRVDARITPIPERRPDIAPVPDLPPALPHYLLWQAPQGFAGTGPVIEITEQTGGAQVHAAASVPQVLPHIKSLWYTTQITLGYADAAALFKLLDAVAYSKLPHKNTSQGECYPVFYCEGCGNAALHEFSYAGAVDLTPEMNAVYDFLWKTLKPQLPGIDLPYAFCAWEAGGTTCGAETCLSATQMCVITNTQTGDTSACKPVPAGCEATTNRTCACAGKALCSVSPFLTCGQSSAGSNTVSCECPNC
jgi:hypothetical protein